MKKTALNCHGFTMIEMILVLGIIALVIGFILSAINPITQIRKANDSRRKSDLREMKTSFSLYYNIYNTVPANDAQGRIVGCCGSTPCVCPWGSIWQRDSNVLMKQLPDDPVSNQDYRYNRISEESYYLVATLELDTDQSVQQSQTRCNVSLGPRDYVVCND